MGFSYKPCRHPPKIREDLMGRPIIARIKKTPSRIGNETVPPWVFGMLLGNTQDCECGCPVTVQVSRPAIVLPNSFFAERVDISDEIEDGLFV